MRHRVLLVAVSFAVAVSIAGPVRAAASDVAGSRDPYGIERYPRSWIVVYEREGEIAPRELVTSRVDRIRRDLRVDDQVQVEAALEAVTYQAPDGVSVADLEQHYLDKLGGKVLFRCEGRACGRSADWANQVFGQSILYGPDRNQRYAALEWRGRLVGLYVIERGNKRVYAHLRILEPAADDRGIDASVLLAQRLTERGWAVIEGARPAADGGIGNAARGVLMELGTDLGALASERVYLVCHLYGEADAERLLERSRACAEEAVRIMAEGVEGASGEAPSLVPFGAGPLLPRSHPPAPRLELVLSKLDPAR